MEETPVQKPDVLITDLARFVRAEIPLYSGESLHAPGSPRKGSVREWLESLAFTVIFATRASLTEFVQTIEVLHLVGARDDYIAGQFARRALTEGIVGGFLGLVLFAPTLATVVWLARQVQTGVLPQVELPVTHWLVLVLLPFVAGILSMLTAHFTVRRALYAMV